MPYAIEVGRSRPLGTAQWTWHLWKIVYPSGRERYTATIPDDMLRKTMDEQRFD